MKTFQYLILTLILVLFSLAIFQSSAVLLSNSDSSAGSNLNSALNSDPNSNWTSFSLLGRNAWLYIFGPDRFFYNVTLYLNFTSDGALAVRYTPYLVEDYTVLIVLNSTGNYTDFEVPHDGTLHVTVNSTTGIYAITLYANYLTLELDFPRPSSNATYANGTYQIRVHNVVSRTTGGFWGLFGLSAHQTPVLEFLVPLMLLTFYYKTKNRKYH